MITAKTLERIEFNPQLYLLGRTIARRRTAETVPRRNIALWAAGH